MTSVSKTFLLGNVGKEPEIKTFDNGDVKATFSVATSDQWTDKQGNKQEATDWHTCVAYRRLAEIAADYVKKGSKVYVEGRPKNKSYEKDGQKHYFSYVEVLKLLVLDKREKSSLQDVNEDTDLPF